MDPTRLLPDDMLLDVLRRLPPASLALSRCVCKAWRAAVDDHRADLLTPSLQGIFLELYDPRRSSEYRGQDFPIPVLFSRPSTGRKIPTDIGYKDNCIGCERSMIIDCCNGLLLLRNDRVVNPATREWAQVPQMPCSVVTGCHGSYCTKYLVFDPTTSPHYEVFVVPRIPGNLYNYGHVICKHPCNSKSFSAMEWPPTPYIMDVFSSRTWLWEERSFVREGNAAGTVANCNVYSFYKGAAYWHGALYLNCEPHFVLRIKLLENTYQVIELPEEKKGFNEIRLGKSAKGVYCAYTCEDQVFQIWFLDESHGHTTWVFKSDLNLKPVLTRRHPDFVSGSWILQQYDRGKALAPESYEWDPDDKDAISTENWVTMDGGRKYDFLGFHPYKEIVILMSSSRRAMACHLNTSKVRSLGYIDLMKSDIQLSFPYTPCWMGPLPGASNHCLKNDQVVDETNEIHEGRKIQLQDWKEGKSDEEGFTLLKNKQVVDDTNEICEGGKIQLQDWTEGKSDDEGFTPVLSKRTRKQIRSAAKVFVGGAWSKSSLGTAKISINHP